MQDIAAAKKSARRIYSELRSNIPEKVRKKKSCDILSKILTLSAYNNCDTVLTYMSFGSEVDTEALILRALKDGKKVALPVSEYDSLQLSFYEISSLSELAAGYKGILEPPPCPDNLVRDFENAICIVPGLAFDKNGYRLGYGKGFYDRFLPSFTGTSVGIAFDECITDSVPIDSYDCKLDILVSDSDIYYPNQALQKGC